MATDYTIKTDTELIQLLQAGDDRAFSVIYERFWPLLYRHARRFLYDDDEARDVIQEVFLLLWEKSADTGIGVSLSAYLFAAVKNRALNVIARSKVREDYAASFGRYMEQATAGTDHRVRSRELAGLIEAEIEALPPKMREAFLLSREDRFTYREIAEQLNVAENTIRKQVSQAIRKLRAKFNDFTSLVTHLLPV